MAGTERGLRLEEVAEDPRRNPARNQVPRHLQIGLQRDSPFEAQAVEVKA